MHECSLGTYTNERSFIYVPDDRSFIYVPNEHLLERMRMAKRDSSASIDVTQGVIWRQLLTLCVPIFFSSFFQQAYTLIGTYIVGQFGGKLALGGIQASLVLTELCVGFSVGLGAGCAVITGQYFGQHDDRRLSTSVHTAMTLALVGGIVVSVAGVLLARPMLVAMHTPPSLLAEGVAYTRCYFAAMFAALLLNMGTALLRAVGDTRGPALIIAAGCGINVCLDLIFVAVLHLEALGCGIATALTICINATMVTLRLMRAQGAWRLDLRRLSIDRPMAKRMISCGLPLGIQSAAYSVSNIVIQVAVNAFGANVTTAWGLSGRLDGVIWMVTEALGVSITTFTAQNFGARNYDRMRRGYHTSLVLSAVLIGALSALLMVFSAPLSRLFVNDARIAGYTTTIIHFIAPFYAIYSIIENASGSIRGTGVSLQPMLLTLFGTCVLRIAWVFAIVPISNTVETLLAVYPVTWSITAALFMWYHHSGQWLGRAKAKA